MLSPTGTSVAAVTVPIPAEETAASSPKKSSLLYEVLTLSSALIITGMAAIFYLQTTEKAALDRKIGSIGSNSMGNSFTAKVSIDFLADLISQGKWGQFFLMSLIAGGAYAPQVLIAVQGAQNKSIGFKFFVGMSTFLSGAVMYAYSLIELVTFIQNTRKKIRHQTHSERIEIANLEIALQRMRFSEHHSVAFAPEWKTNPNLMIQMVIALAKTAPVPMMQTQSSVLSFIRRALQICVSAFMIYGNLGLTCATSDSLIDNGLPYSLSITAANVLMFLQYVLNVKGAFTFVSTLFDGIVDMYNYRGLSTDYKMGGKLGIALTFILPALSAVLAAFSGYTSMTLFRDHCPNTFFRLLMFSAAASMVNWSAKIFNAIFSAMACRWFLIYAVEKVGNSERAQKDFDYLALTQKVSSFLEDLKMSSAEAIDEKMVELGDVGNELKTPHLFFPKPVVVRDEERSLLDANPTQVAIPQQYASC